MTSRISKEWSNDFVTFQASKNDKVYDTSFMDEIKSIRDLENLNLATVVRFEARANFCLRPSCLEMYCSWSKVTLK